MATVLPTILLPATVNPMDAPTPLARLVEERLRQAGHIAAKGRGLRSLHDWVQDRRNFQVSWQYIAQDLRLLTGEGVTDETVRSWWLSWYPRPTETAPETTP